MNHPVIFIPGLFGSWGDDIIKGTGNFSFGFANKIYDPFIDMLDSMGYEEGVNLFISYYNWKRPVLESVDKYLSLDIKNVKRKTGSEKVILIGHSLGGLLGRAYMSYFIPSDIEKLIMIGTPNLGSANAYYFWSGGKLPYSKVEDNVLYNGLKFGFWMYSRLFHNMDHVDAWRNSFPIAKDLLPSYKYGNYLFYRDKEVRTELPIESMSIQNSFLNGLDEKLIDQDKIFIITGKGAFTNMSFEIDKQRKDKNKWVDGKPIRAYRTNQGDGTVIVKSTLGDLGANNIMLEGNHTDILYKSNDYLSLILDKPIVEEGKGEKVEKVHLVFGQNCEKMNIITSDNNELAFSHMDITDSRVKAMDLGENNFWVMVTGDKELQIDIELESAGYKKAKIYKSTIELK